MKNKYVMSRLLALGMAATLTASNLPMTVSAADETVEVSQTTEQEEQNTEKQETEEMQTEGTQQEETTEGTTEEIKPESQQTENAGTENAENETLPQLNTGLIQAGKYDTAGNWVAMEGNELLTNDQVIFNLKWMVPEGYTYNSANILVDGQWIQADENGYVAVNKTSTATQVGMWLEKDGQVLAEPVMASVNYKITVDQTAPMIKELSMYTMNDNGNWEDFEGGVTNKDVMLDMVAEDDVEVDYVFYTSESGATPVFEKIPGTNNAYRYVFKEAGVYNGVISVKDKAGNYTEQAVSFTIDKTAPTLDELHLYAMNEDGTYEDLTEGGSTGKDVMIDVVANDDVEVDYVFYTSETGATPVFEKIEGTDNAYRHIFTKPGVYNGVISVKDKAGNYTEKEVSFTIKAKRDTLMVVNFETSNGKKVGKEVVLKKQGLAGEDVTFELGKDFQIPKGYKFATEKNQVEVITIPAGTTGGHTVLVEKGGNSSIVKVQFVDAETNKVVAGGDYFVDGDGDGVFTHREVVEYVPEEYVLKGAGDYQVVDYAENALQLSVVKKETQKDVMANYVLEDGSNVGTGSVKIHKDYNYVNTSWLADVPYGYELAIVGDINLNEDGQSVNIVVREKKYTKDISVEYVTEDGTFVGKGSLKVAEESTYINTSWLQDVPEGYEIAIVGDLPIENNLVKVVVRTAEKPEKPDPEKPEKPNPEEPNKPAPEKPNKDDNNKDDGKTQNTDKVTDKKVKTPKTGDDLQAAGAFSILGAGALAAIVALLKKRK